jgi:3-hydroxyacyl-CoA dehydrogenase/3a,7a,12a-trihydroxy-5b-cholest-24-enoyl-CoA hydratase
MVDGIIINVLLYFFFLVGVSTQQPDYLKFLFEGSDDFTTIPTYGVIPGFIAMASASGERIPGFPIDPTKVRK